MQVKKINTTYTAVRRLACRNAMLEIRVACYKMTDMYTTGKRGLHHVQASNLLSDLPGHQMN